MTKLTKYEKETSILFNEDESDATIFTYNRKWQRHLEGKLGLTPEFTNTSDGRSYKIPKSWVPLPRRKRKLNKEQKKELTDRLNKPPKGPEDKNHEMKAANEIIKTKRFLKND